MRSDRFQSLSRLIAALTGTAALSLRLVDTAPVEVEDEILVEAAVHPLAAGRTGIVMVSENVFGYEPAEVLAKGGRVIFSSEGKATAIAYETGYASRRLIHVMGDAGWQQETELKNAALAWLQAGAEAAQEAELRAKSGYRIVEGYSLLPHMLDAGISDQVVQALTTFIAATSAAAVDEAGHTPGLFSGHSNSD